MRTLKSKLLLALFAIIGTCGLYAQDNTQNFWVHEVDVTPGMNGEYESACNELTSNMKNHNVQDFNFFVAQSFDNRYLWVGPIANMAALDKNVFKGLSEKMGEDKVRGNLDRAYDCYSNGHNYVITLHKDLSYQPGGINLTPEGQNYRKFHYFHYSPKNRAKVMEKAKAIKEMFTNGESKLEYRAYHSGFGVDGDYLMVAIAAKNAGDYAEKIAKNNELLGEDWANLYNAFMATLDNYEVVEGVMRPDMGYAPANQ